MDAPPVDDGTLQTYIMRPGDTLAAVASRFGISVSDVMDANKELIADPERIQVGWEIAIPLGAGPVSEILSSEAPLDAERARESVSDEDEDQESTTAFTDYEARQAPPLAVRPRLADEVLEHWLDDGADAAGAVGTVLDILRSERGLPVPVSRAELRGNSDHPGRIISVLSGLQIHGARAAGAGQAAPATVERVRHTLVRNAIAELHGALVVLQPHEGWYKAERGIIPPSPDFPLLPDTQLVPAIGYDADGLVILNPLGANREEAVLGWGDFEKAFVDGWAIRLDAREDELVLPSFNPDRAEGGQDHLNITPDVNAFGSLIAWKELTPPLSVGLFGNWGSGKTFFMDQLYQAVQGREQEARDAEGESPWCRSIAQIRFNAWHFLDANLWASLVSEIFDSLLAHATGEPRGGSAEVESRLVVAEGAYQQALAQAQAARQRLSVAKEARTAAIERQARLAAELDAFKVAADAAKSSLRFLADDRPTDPQVQTVREVLGDSVLGTAEEASKRVRELQEGTARLRETVVFLLSSRRISRTLLGALLGILAALVVWLVAGHWAGQLQAVVAAAVPVLGAASAALGWAGRRVRGATTALEALLAEAAALEDKSRNRDMVLEEAWQAVLDADARVRETEQELKPGRQMFRFLEERSASGDYRKHLGIVSLVRRDFEALDTYMQGAADSDTRIERVVLYIDDLDRCKPERVVEVLEAVHLLLALPLFVVVVAVDPRWLYRCLAKHYPQLLDDSGTAAAGQATPQDYLEKIFQIPYRLPPIDDGGYRALIRELTVRQTAPSTAQLDRDKSPAAPAHALEDAGGAGAAVSNADRTSGDDLSAIDHPLAPLARDMRFQPWEFRDLTSLSAHFDTPRAVKRFLNTYRLLRATVPASEMAAFEGTEDQAGEYRKALALLAAASGHPRVAGKMLSQLEAAIERPQSRRRPTRWRSWIRAERGRASGEWAEVCRLIERAFEGGLGEDSLPDFAPWVSRVGRYAFVVGDGAGLTEAEGPRPPEQSPEPETHAGEPT